MSERKLVGTNEMFKKALAGGYAIGAYNVNNMEILQAIAEAAEETRSPIILQVSAGARKYANQTYLVKLVEAALETTTVPIALHLDHGADFEICKACIDGGFSSVMIDGSRFSFEENVAVTKKVVDYAHERGVSVEAELGKLAGVEDDVNVDAKDAKYTNVKEAVEFVKQTGCDSLAIAIGTSHGAYKFSGEAKLDFDRLKEIKDALKEAYRVIKDNGILIISVANGFLCSESKKILPGLIIPGTEFVDIYRGFSLVKTLYKELIDVGFNDIRIYSSNSELYLTAKVYK